jgi:hypothetical protein
MRKNKCDWKNVLRKDKRKERLDEMIEREGR